MKVHIKLYLIAFFLLLSSYFIFRISNIFGILFHFLMLIMAMLSLAVFITIIGALLGRENNNGKR